MFRANRTAAWIATSLLALAALIQVSTVTERVGAAMWQWYKFKDYGEGGFITLGRETGVLFVSGSVTLIAGGLWLSRRDNEIPVIRGRIINASLLLLTLGLVSYFFLAFSPLNSWRP